MVGTSTDNLRNYKCVPLDLLRNVAPEEGGEYSIQLTSDAPTLRDFKEQQAAEIRAAGPLGAKLSADAIESLMVAIIIFFAVIIFVAVLFWGTLNFRANGFAGFQLPTQLKSLPAVALFSLAFAVVFGIGGFLLGRYLQE